MEKPLHFFKHNKGDTTQQKFIISSLSEKQCAFQKRLYSMVYIVTALRLYGYFV
jgi:hypothetical protein